MAATVKPIKVYGHVGPNPMKVQIVLHELDIPFEEVNVPIADVKNPDFVAVNPNGRIPAIYDPNTDLTLWESGAIIEYLVHQYDAKAHKLSFPANSHEDWHTKQWLYLQTTGQGPYYGQAFWFTNYHPEPVPSAIERYTKEMNRVTGVLEQWLGKQKEQFGADAVKTTNGPWLVGNKMTYADISFIPWQIGAARRFEKSQFDEDNYPNVKEWMAKMMALESSKTVEKNR